MPPQYNANLEARMKYADQPDRFMESEADLDEAVKALLVVASAPDLYPELVARWGLLGRCIGCWSLGQQPVLALIMLLLRA